MFLFSPVKVASYDLFSRMISQTCLIFPFAGEGAEVADEVPADAVASRVAATAAAASTPAGSAFLRCGILGIIFMGGLAPFVFGFSTPGTLPREPRAVGSNRVDRA